MEARVGHAQRPRDVLAHEGRQRLAMPYSQVSPGWATSGSCASLVMKSALVNLPLNRPASRYIFLTGCSVPTKP
jgi:hypothetical protein